MPMLPRIDEHSKQAWYGGQVAETNVLRFVKK
jgi:hypothetical protein